MINKSRWAILEIDWMELKEKNEKLDEKRNENKNEKKDKKKNDSYDWIEGDQMKT